MTAKTRLGLMLIFLCKLVNQRSVFLRLLHREIGHHPHGDVLDRLLGSVLVHGPRGRFLFKKIRGEWFGFCRRAYRFILLIEDEAEEVGLLVSREDDFLVGK